MLALVCMVKVTAWVEPLAGPVGSTTNVKESVSLVKVSVWATVTVAVVEEPPKVTDGEVAESIVDGVLVRVVMVEV